MITYESKEFQEYGKTNSYLGRGIIVGQTPNKSNTVAVYFIMGRSENSRNRVFVQDGDIIKTAPADISKCTDPSLIIYNAIRKYENYHIITNGDQTDTIFEHLMNNQTFENALDTRKFEPDSPNFTPRISAIINTNCENLSYKMSILKSADSVGGACNRFYYNYSAVAGVGHFIHTYEGNFDPLPPFVGEPKRIKIPNDIMSFVNNVWDSLDSENRISLVAKIISLDDGTDEYYILNKQERI